MKGLHEALKRSEGTRSREDLVEVLAATGWDGSVGRGEV